MNELPHSAVERLRAHKDELRALGIRSLSVFGSIARGEGGPAPDMHTLPAPYAISYTPTDERRS